MELTRYDLKNQALLERIAKALEDLVEIDRNRNTALMERLARALEAYSEKGVKK